MNSTASSWPQGGPGSGGPQGARAVWRHPAAAQYPGMKGYFSWIRIHSVETITSVFLHIPFVFATYYLTDMIMSWYANGFHITAPFVKEFHNTLVDSPHRGPVMQSFSVSFVVNLNKLLNQQFSCWWSERLCHCKVTHLCHMILLQYMFFAILHIFPSECTHMLQNLLFRFQSVFSSTSTVVVFSSLFGHSCSVIWCVGQSDEWTTGVRSVDPMRGGWLLGVPLTPDISLSSLLHAPSAPPVTVVNRWPVAEIDLPSKSSG